MQDIGWHGQAIACSHLILSEKTGIEIMHHPDDIQRAIKLRKIMNDYIRNKTPQERDRMMQIHLAQARGTKMNAQLLRHSMNAMLQRKQKS